MLDLKRIQSKTLKNILLLTVALSCFGNVRAQWEVKSLQNSLVSVERDNSICKISFSPSNIGIAVGSDGLILRSIDSGNTWKHIPYDSSYSFADVFVLNDSVMYAVAGKYKFGNVLIKSVDSGLSWKTMIVLSNEQLYSVWFMNSDTGFICGNMGMHKTMDAGKTWKTVYGESIPSNEHLYIGKLKFVSDTFGYAFGETNYGQFILKTTDAGANWQTIDLIAPVTYISDMFCLDENNIFLSSHYGGRVFRSNDGGINWKSSTAFPYNDNSQIRSIFFTSKSTGYAVVGRDYDFTSVDFRSSTWISGFKICKSIDSGKTWKTFDSNGIPLNFVCFFNDSVGFVAGYFELIMKTTHAGGNEIIGNYPWWRYNAISEKNPSTFQNVRVFPSLFNNLISIELQNKLTETTYLRMMNSVGQVVCSTTISAGEILKSINTSLIGTGFYLLELRNGIRSASFKVIKQ